MIKSLLSLGFLASLPSLLTAAPTAIDARSSHPARGWTAANHPDCHYPDLMANPFWVGNGDPNVNNYSTSPKEESIVRAAFLFMKGGITEVVNQDFTFDDNLEALNAQHTTNATVTFSNTINRSKSRKLTQSNSHQIGVGYTWKFSADVLDVMKVEAGLSLSYTYTHIDTTETSTSEGITLKRDNTNLVVSPGKTIYCKASVLTGTYSSGYSSYVHIHPDTGKEFSFLSRGQLELVGWSSVQSSCDDVEYVPAGIEELPTV
ncbi:hypothetical protein K469DRAFT_681864 [Zopfia rhizophila CBS 207.26]|uniref:Uncharacterized protein n=1 Tax=Zopfia rhizophila CBS 207.26 TaxID=1314779 RepID=A0A6A6EVI0_9PEZI|nr:hypothetical protein K469DRAFT_681864 [Zopfia rhizophila CBS 207.26]